MAIKKVIFIFYINILCGDLHSKKGRPKKPLLVVSTEQLLHACAVGLRRSEGGKMFLRVLEFLAIVLTAIILMPSGAHFFELPNKIRLVQDQYFVVQNIYRGWALFGTLIFPALVFTALLGFLARDNPLESRLAFFACLCIAASLGVFFGFVYPGNF